MAKATALRSVSSDICASTTFDRKFTGQHESQKDCNLRGEAHFARHSLENYTRVASVGISIFEPYGSCGLRADIRKPPFPPQISPRTPYRLMSSPKSKVVASSIPTITNLRRQLEYGEPRLSRCKIFYDDVRAFRKKYCTHDGFSGISLHVWKLPEHQAGLTNLTEAYLDEQGNGTLYWPDDDASIYRNKLRYSQDHDLYLAQLSVTPPTNLVQDKAAYEAALFPVKSAAVSQHQI